MSPHHLLTVFEVVKDEEEMERLMSKAAEDADEDALLVTALRIDNCIIYYNIINCLFLAFPSDGF